MLKKPNRIQNKTRVRQKISRRLSLIVGFSIVTIAGTGILLYFYFGNVDDMKARSNVPVNIVVVPEQTFVNEFTIPEPVIVHQPKADAKTIFVRKAKPANSSTN